MKILDGHVGELNQHERRVLGVGEDCIYLELPDMGEYQGRYDALCDRQQAIEGDLSAWLAAASSRARNPAGPEIRDRKTIERMHRKILAAGLASSLIVRSETDS